MLERSSKSRVSDDELVREFLEGNSSAFDELVRRHSLAVYRAAMAALRSAADAEDVMQETFMLAFQRLGGFRHEASFKTWLLTIAWRRALQRRRSLTWQLKQMVTVDEEFPQQVLPRAPSVEQALMASERGRDLRRLIVKLPARLRDPLLLKATGHVDYEEMAHILGIPTGTARWRVSEARRLLRLKLARMGHL